MSKVILRIEMNLDKKTIAVAIVIILLVLSLGWYFSDSGEEQPKLETAELHILNSEGENVTVQAEIADTDEERKIGLMNRDSLCENCGMLFVYEENVTHGFWMKDTTIPLSIAFISEDGTIMDIQQMEPETRDTHKPEDPYRYALEVNQGFFQERNIEVGAVVDIPEKFTT